MLRIRADRPQQAIYTMQIQPKLVLALLLACLLQSKAIDSECSACEAVAGELQRRLEAEVPRTHLDMRHRLDKDGNRYGKVINYKVSEMRAVNLLDDLCSGMADFTFIEQEEEHKPDSSSDNNSSSDGAATEVAVGADADADASAEAAEPERSTKPKQKKGSKQANGQLMWVKHRGEGSVRVPAGKRPGKAEEELRVKQLTTFCGLLIERHEDEVVEALMSDQFTLKGAAPMLCQQISNKCKGKQYQQPVDPNYRSSSSAGEAKEEL